MRGSRTIPGWRTAAALTALLLLALAAPAETRAQVACTADDFGCPASDTCTISGTWDIDDDGPCGDLDFGSRNVTVTGTLRALNSSGSFSIEAASVSLNGGKLRAPGTAADSGGTITVTVVGDFVMQSNTALVLVDGDDGGGGVEIDAGGAIRLLAGTITSKGTHADTTGGSVVLTAAGLLDVAASIDVEGTGGSNSAGGAIGLEGASVSIESSVNATGQNGAGGTIDVTADATTITVTAAGTLQANAGDGDADAFAISLTGPDDITINGRIESTGGPPAGSGGSIAIKSGGSINVGAVLIVEGKGDGGDIGLDAAGNATVNANLLASGGIDGTSAIDVAALGNVSIAAGVTVQAHGGSIDTASPEVLTMNGTLDVSGRANETAGSIELEHCTVTVNGTLDARGANGPFTGTNELIGYAISVNATARLLATACTPPAGHTSCNILRIRSGTPTVASGATINPARERVVDPGIKSCCGNDVLDAGEDCDDGNHLYCDTCSPQCTTPVACDADGNACTGACVPETGCTPLTNTPCESDANPCTDDVCQNGVCHHPSPCDGTNDPPCKVGSCDPEQGCVFEDVPDGTDCTANGCAMHVCQAGQCVTECDDHDPCTSDSCGASYCLNEEQPSFCPCTSGNDPLPAGTHCVDGDQCTHPDTCNGSGVCIGGPIEDDGDPCTLELDQGTTCGHFDLFVCPNNCSGLADGTPCSDLNACTTGACQGGVCVSTPITCDVPSCGGTMTCEQFHGCQPVTFGTPCEDDGNPCTEGRCDPDLGCVQDPLTGTPCGSDADACTTDVCNAGTCMHPPIACDDQIACTVDGCADPGGCTHAPDNAACDDGDPCTQDSCNATTGCQHDPVDCDDGDACTADSCNATGMCEHADTCGVDDFKCYRAHKTPGSASPLPIAGVAVANVFGSLAVDVKKSTALCAPVSTDGGDPTAPGDAGHLAGYQIKAAAGSPKFMRRTNLAVTNRFGTIVVDARTRRSLLAPSAKGLSAPPGDLVPPTPDHYECYDVKVSQGTGLFQPIADVTLDDQFGTENVVVKKPLRLCNPANVDGGDPSAPSHATRLLCYQVKVSAASTRLPGRADVHVKNPFGDQTIDLVGASELCVPSTVAP